MHTILLVDDDEIHQVLMQKILEREGYAVVSAGDFTSGIEMFEEHHPALVLLDHHLSDRKSLDLLEEIRRRDQRAKVLVLSRFGWSESIAVAMFVGVTGLIARSTEMDVLLGIIKNVLDLTI